MEDVHADVLVTVWDVVAALQFVHVFLLQLDLIEDGECCLEQRVADETARRGSVGDDENLLVVIDVVWLCWFSVW